MMLLTGAAIVGLWVWGLVVFSRRYQAIDRERFERTNPAGVLEFASYEEKVRFERRASHVQSMKGLLAVPGGPIAVVGLLMVFASIFG